MRKFIVCVVAVSALAVIGCGSDKDETGGTSGSDVCTKMDTWMNKGGLLNKFNNCPELKTQMEQQMQGVTFDTAACTAGISKCTSADIAEVNKMLTCFDNVPNCDMNDLTGFMAAFQACDTNLESKLSAACNSVGP